MILAQRQKEEVYQGFLKAEAALKWIAENPQIHRKEVQEDWAFYIYQCFEVDRSGHYHEKVLETH